MISKGVVGEEELLCLWQVMLIAVIFRIAN